MQKGCCYYSGESSRGGEEETRGVGAKLKEVTIKANDVLTLAKEASKTLQTHVGHLETEVRQAKSSLEALGSERTT